MDEAASVHSEDSYGAPGPSSSTADAALSNCRQEFATWLKNCSASWGSEAFKRRHTGAGKGKGKAPAGRRPGPYDDKLADALSEMAGQQGFEVFSSAAERDQLMGAFARTFAPVWRSASHAALREQYLACAASANAALLDLYPALTDPPNRFTDPASPTPASVPHTRSSRRPSAAGR